MQVNPRKLNELITKASLNYSFNYSKDFDTLPINFTPNKIVSMMISPENDFLVWIEKPNDVITKMGNKKELLLNFKFDKGSKKFLSDSIKGMSNDCQCKASGMLKISDNGSIIKISLSPLLIAPEWPLFDNDYFYEMDLTPDYIKQLKKFKKIKRPDKLYWMIHRNKVRLLLEQLPIEGNTGQLSIPLPGKVKTKFKTKVLVPLNYKNFKKLIDLLDKNIEYQMKFNYNEKDVTSHVLITSKDNSEQYFLFPIVDVIKYEPVKFEPAKVELREQDKEFNFKNPPELPEKWNYTDSVKSVRKVVYKWKTISQEMLKELWIAREMLSKSHSEASQIGHGTLVSRKKLIPTWSQYCEDIGSSRQVVNRWLKKALDGNGNNTPSLPPPTTVSPYENMRIQKTIYKKLVSESIKYQQTVDEFIKRIYDYWLEHK